MAKKVVLGCELNRDFFQIVYAPEGGRPVGLNIPGTEELLQVPLAIARAENGDGWIYGEDAAAMADKKGYVAQDLYAKRGGSVKLAGDLYTYDELLHLVILFGIRLAIIAMEKLFSDDVDIVAMTVSCDPFPSDTKTFQERCFKGLPVGKVFLQGHEESIFSYLIHQPERMLGYVTGVFDLTTEEMKVYCMELNPRTSPVVVSITKDDDTGIVKKKHYPSIMEHDRTLEEMDKKLAEYTKNFTSGRIVTSIYLIGDGFKKDWYKTSRAVLCRSRKVFAGNNLFSKGAAFSAASIIWPGTEKEDFLYLGRDMITCNIGMQVMDQGQEAYMPLLDAGTAWYDAKCETELLLESADEIVLLIQPVSGMDTYEEHIRIGIDEQRDGRAFRFLLKLSMKDPYTLEAVIKDEGFGSIFPVKYPDIVETVNLKKQDE
ncbi:MAG: hypothetical protein J5842_03410 [Lachnospiraceae bacterium]|nr:hypothetical protein [Lachnospiraceae bacterium]